MALHWPLLWVLCSLLASVGSASFSLNVSGPDWDYTVASLKNSTSFKCQQAYSAPIDCSDTLLGLVASMQPSFHPDASDLDATCTPGCKQALQAYVNGVRSSCSLPGDAAEVLVQAVKPYRFADQPVELVGQLFQYTLAQSCREATNGTYCYLSYSIYADTDFDCGDSCYTSFYRIAHDYPASAYWFNYFDLLPQTSYWTNTFSQGYDHLLSCGPSNSSQGPLVSSVPLSSMPTEASTLIDGLGPSSSTDVPASATIAEPTASAPDAASGNSSPTSLSATASSPTSSTHPTISSVSQSAAAAVPGVGPGLGGAALLALALLGV